QTGWTFDEAKDRIFYLNVRAAQTPRWIYPKKQGRTTGSIPDGFFAALASETPPDQGDVMSWLLAQNIQENISTGLLQGGIEVGGPQKLSKRFWLIPYFVRDKENFLPYFHNSGEGYDTIAKTGAKAPSNRSVSAVFNHCPNRPEYCR